MLIHPLQCIETTVEGTDGTGVWDVAGATAEQGKNNVYLSDRELKITDVSQ